MSGPPGLTTPAIQPDLGANHEGARAAEFLSVQTLARQARHIVDADSIPLSGSQLRRLLRNFVNEGHSVVDLRAYILGYADPTGKKAAGDIDATPGAVNKIRTLAARRAAHETTGVRDARK